MSRPEDERRHERVQHKLKRYKQLELFDEQIYLQEGGVSHEEAPQEEEVSTQGCEEGWQEAP